MSHLIVAMVAIAGTIFTFGTHPANDTELTEKLLKNRWHIKGQYFASHDIKGTDYDTVVCNSSDYIRFNKNGLAYCYFNCIYDTMEYKFIGKDSISFGDTPFLMTSPKPEIIEFYQNEEEKNGDYNRVHYILSSEK